ncbi:MAG TPA: type II toxin-antitoxin system RelE/ParE family toxin [Mesorhizobium sp.]
MAWRLEYLQSARKSVERLNPQIRQRIRMYLVDRVATLDDPRKIGKPLKGPMSAYWRFRVGDYRIICDIQDDRLVILVVTVGHRSNIYQSPARAAGPQDG